MRRALAIAVGIDLLFLAVVFYTPLKDFLYVHTWVLSALAAAPGIAIAFLELLHSGEANNLRREANEFRDEANTQRGEANAQRERANEALSRIADHTKRPPTKAEKTAERLQRYLRAKAQVINADDTRWTSAAEIVEIKNDVVTLFTPAGFTSSSASVMHVHCEDLEIIEAASRSLTLKVLKRYGTTENLGQITTWEERLQPSTVPNFSKGPNIFNVQFSKPGSSEKRRLDVFESADGQNSYMLVASTGEILCGDNREVARHFLLMQLDLEVQGFRQTGSASGGSKYPLYIKTRS